MQRLVWTDAVSVNDCGDGTATVKVDSRWMEAARGEHESKQSNDITGKILYLTKEGNEGEDAADVEGRHRIKVFPQDGGQEVTGLS